MLETTANTYFKHLYGARFIAALVVLIAHVELLKHDFGIVSWHENPLVGELAQLAVTFFFVLSGFLITFHLLKEQQETGTIQLWRFFKRRVLRIWPLYFFVVGLTFFVLPHFTWFQIPVVTDELHYHFQEKITLFVVFLPQLANLLYPKIPMAEPLWSIGVEEQFYLIWPFLLRLIRKPIVAIVILFIIYFSLRMYFFWKFWYTTIPEESLQYENYYRFFFATRIDAMALGGLGAWFWLKSTKSLQFLMGIWQQAILFFLLAGYLYFISGPAKDHTLFSILSVFLILNWVGSEKRIISLETPLLKYLGKISYGIYLWHEVVIVCLLNVLIQNESTVFQKEDHLLLYCGSIATTIGLAAFSYWVYQKMIVRFR